ncbi:glycosyl hydrolases family 43 domain-containing protein [Pochonia chlamydosporia 170]|uniref:Glycosyl hydrolases family 43 domain-containing protein n=1 Tax=Pochonia chlamydosporia 170 TaxID=1380566 RepID=A0A179F1B6_METCM|nr:glycosyl hydrolases family 43 domain-containing protein [Pochonia chlamydosporia 170]OAQ59218.1 glycosyl hydrolases family 43 domain-containing protein [Pochonia chlamydosporia 170]
MFFSLFANHCPLKSWMPFSTIAHATSRTGPAGPYESPVQVVGTFAHNPTVIWSPADKEYLMYHIGCPQPAPDVCGPTKFTCGAPDGQSGITVRSSRDLATWTNRGMVFNGTYDKTVWDRTATNPSAWPLYSSKNKTHAILLAYRGNSLNATNFSSGNIAVSSHGFEGPYTRIQKNSLMPVRFEDPFLWQDKRGNYHMLVHAQQDGNGGTPGVKQTGRHAYARDYHGPWTYGNRTLAYGALVNFTDGTSINYGRRERPQLLFSEDGNMVPLFMTNGVQEKGTNMSYTIVSPIGDAGAKLQ